MKVVSRFPDLLQIQSSSADCPGNRYSFVVYVCLVCIRISDPESAREQLQKHTRAHQTVYFYSEIARYKYLRLSFKFIPRKQVSYLLSVCDHRSGIIEARCKHFPNESINKDSELLSRRDNIDSGLDFGIH